MGLEEGRAGGGWGWRRMGLEMEGWAGGMNAVIAEYFGTTGDPEMMAIPRGCQETREKRDTGGGEVEEEQGRQL